MTHPYRIPHYPRNTDYTTNAASYYDDLARKNELMKHLAQRIWEYDKELSKRFLQWDQNLEDLPDDLKRLLEQWFDDGTLANIMADLMLTDYAKKNDVEDFKLLTGIDLNRLKTDKVDTLGYYHEIETTTHRHGPYRTTYYLTKIPKLDSNGDPIVLKQGIAKESFSSVGSETVREFSKRKGATFASNVSPSTTLSRIIHKGQILRDAESIDPFRETLAFNENGDMRSYPRDVPAQTILNDGYTEAMTTFAPLIVNGQINEVSYSDYLAPVHPRSVVGKDAAGNTYFMQCDGRRLGERGLTVTETAEVMLSHGMVFAQMLDGGGSTQATLYHANINKLSDQKGTRADGYVIGQSERLRSNFLYVGKDVANDPLTKIFSHLGDLNKNASDRLTEYENINYTPNRWRSFNQYLINGWEEFSTIGAHAVRAWVMPNNTIYMSGVVRNGAIDQPFMQLPPKYWPMFSFSFVTSGRLNDELYRVICGSDGMIRLEPLTATAANNPVTYAKLDGIFFPINPNFEDVEETGEI